MPAMNEILNMFPEQDNDPEHHYIISTLEREPAIKTRNDALLDIYKKLRPGDPPNIENAKKLINNLFFSPQHYDLG